MVTMTLIQGVVNAFAMFLAEVVATLGLLLVIFSLARTGRGDVSPFADAAPV